MILFMICKKNVKYCHGVSKLVTSFVRFEVFTTVTMKNAVFWDVALCRYCVNRRLQKPAHAGSSLADFSTLKMEAIRSSETLVHTRSTRSHIPEDGILCTLLFKLRREPWSLSRMYIT
jgi:hypothetical protein